MKNRCILHGLVFVMGIDLGTPCIQAAKWHHYRTSYSARSEEPFDIYKISFKPQALEVWPLNPLKCFKYEITVALRYCYVHYRKPYDILAKIELQAPVFKHGVYFGG